jgi:alpha/beta superfamily hydrolase
VDGQVFKVILHLIVIMHMKNKDVLFPCGQLQLEGVCYYPDGAGKFPGVVLCHPHPRYGGSMINNVILELATVLPSKGIIAFIFNFRGVGKSQGSFDSGIGEQEDVKAAIDWLVSQPEADTGRIGVAGYSFGASVALPETRHDPRVRALALISPALMDDPKISHLSDYPIPKLIISGDADEYVSSRQLDLVKQQTAEPKQFEIIHGVDHFWHGYEDTLAEKVTTFFDVVFN